jgi:acyl-homoserine lactone acylase PvdQ
MRGRGWLAGAALALALAAAPTSPTLAAAPAPYGLHDAGGFRNVLPAGENGTDNAAQLAAFETLGVVPPHWDDQQPLYDGLLYASAKPGFGMADVDRYYKDATFGVKPGDVESTESPKPGVTIVRDSAYGVPHIYGATAEDVAWGTGYAGAEDRLFLMDILRHTGEAELSSFVGGSPANRAMDHTQWQLAPYTPAELQRQVDDAGRFYGAQGRELQRLVAAYVAGINAYIDATRIHLTLLPGEYAALGKLPQPWTEGDVIATASLIGGIFGKGGGSELRSAELEQRFVKRFGKRGGRRAWSDFREANDPEAPTTVVGKRFPYETTPAFARRGLAMPDPGSVSRAPVAPPISKHAAASSARASAAAANGRYDFGGIGYWLAKALAGPPHASNWELVSARASATGHPIGVLGPQVGYYVPQILMEEDLHGPGFDARGATFPGVNLYVLLGHGTDYAWSATTATSDNVDTFAEVLCKDNLHYRYKGRCLPMRKLVRINSWTPNLVDSTPAGSEKLTAYRTVHGIVFARGTVHGRKVAFVSARSTYFHEADSALFFQDLNDPRFMRRGSRAFDEAAKFMNYSFNWVYLDSKHTDYQLTGWFPRRARGTSPDFPILGTGKFDWKGYDPSTHEADWLPQGRHPHALDQRYIVSWNNKQAPGWAAADDQYAYGPIFRQELIADRIHADLRGGHKVTLPELVQSMEEPATEDIRAVKLLPLIERAIGHPRSAKLQSALAELNLWRRSGSHRRDLDKDGTYEHNSAVELMDAWWPKLLGAEFKGALGGKLYDQLQGLLPQGVVGFGSPAAPDFGEGWYGYVSKDLRDLFGQRPPAPYSRVYCGGGSRARCRAALRRSLAAALETTPQQIYGFGDCTGDPTPRCFDFNRSTVAAAVSVPETMPFQNRPTFQQAIEIPRRLPR